MRHVKHTQARKFVTDASTGRIYPIPAGGAGEENGSGEGGGEEAGGEDGLGDAGKRALQAERQRATDRDKAAKAAERERDQLKQQLADFQSKDKSDVERERDVAAKSAADEATKAERGRWSTRIVSAELKAAATGKLADPSDAVVFIDLDDFDVSEDGEIDASKLTKAIDELVKSKPHLAKDAANSGDFDQGVRVTPTTKELEPGLPRLRDAFATK